MAFCLAMPAWAGEKRAEPAVETSRTARPAASPVKASLSTAFYDVLKSITIAPGQSWQYDSTINFAGADRVAVTYRAPSSVDLSKMYSYAFWAVPEADWLVAPEVGGGANLLYTNTGGEFFNVYGSQFRLVLENRGNSTITLTQVLVYIRSL
jgi:hypothetical protein